MLLFPVFELPYGGRLVALCPPDLGRVEVPAPQLPVEALSGQRVLLDLEGVVFDVVKGWRHNPRPVLLDALQDGLRPAGHAGANRNRLQLFKPPGKSLISTFSQFIQSVLASLRPEPRCCSRWMSKDVSSVLVEISLEKSCKTGVE